MDVVRLVFALGWATFWVYWIAVALFVRRGRVLRARGAPIRVALSVLVIVLIRAGALRDHGPPPGVLRVSVGLVLFAAGLAGAIWARIYIGRNWGTPMSRKLEPELVDSGPYRYVRHPIYTGILLAGVGTAVALNWAWLVIVALTGAYFVYSAIVEERNLTEQLPDVYPAYQRSTRMLLPFVF